ncbi:hypothetical protein Tco_1151854, partial [Tanacetum coccineum]
MNKSRQEKEEPPQNSVFRQLIKEMCGTKASVEQKQKLEDTMLELLKDCRQKALYCMHNDVEDLIERKEGSLKYRSAATKRRTRITKSLQNFKVILKESTIPLNKMPQISLVNAITHDLPSECDLPVNDESSLTFTTFSNPLFDSNDDFSSSDDESLSNEDVPKENFKIYSNPLFDEEIISTKIDPHYFNAESNLIESSLNRDTLID